MNFEELKNAKHDIIDVAKPRSLRLLGMVEPTGPVESDIGIATVELDGGADGPAGGGLTESEQAVKHGTVLADVKPLEMAREGVVGERLGGDGGEEFDVVVGVEAADVGGVGRKGAVDLHAAVEGVVDDQVVGHADPVGFHWVALAVVVVADARLVEVAHAPLLRVGPRWERRATHAFFHYRNPNRSLFLSFLQVAELGCEIW